MNLNFSKKFEFSASHQLKLEQVTADENDAIYGKESKGNYGHGHNYNAYFSFEGEINQKTGMIINISEIKDKIESFLLDRYDHRFLNKDTKPFDKLAATSENIASELLKDAKNIFSDSVVTPVVCHLSESNEKESTAYANDDIESHYWIDFSAARVTCSPHLSDKENRKLFGAAASANGHGHNYSLRLTLKGKIDPVHGLLATDKSVREVLNNIFNIFDHKNINKDIEVFKSRPTTTEMLAKYIFELASEYLPVDRVKLYENKYFFFECDKSNFVKMAVTDNFYVAHRLHSVLLSDSENLIIFGKCNNLHGHGHNYTLETTIINKLDEQSGTVFDLKDMTDIINNIIEPWQYKHLNREVDDFKKLNPTGENIISVLWDKFENKFSEKLYRLRIWETANNRFSMRR